MKLIYKLDLDLLPLELNAKIQVWMSIYLDERVRPTDTQTDKQCQNNYTRHIREVGPKNMINVNMIIFYSGETAHDV